jgi:hypothetical protein
MMMIKALAGTGKTTVLIQLVRIFAQELSKTVLCVAFAKRDKLALEERAKGQATVKTSNGAGWGILLDWSKAQGIRLEMNDDVSWRILEAQWRADGLIVGGGDNAKSEWKESYNAFQTTLSIVGKIRTIVPLNAKTKPMPTAQDIADVIERFDIEIAQDEYAVVEHYTMYLFQQLASMKVAQTFGVDFAGQVFLPVYHNMRPSKTFDIVLVDECQDQNFYNRQLVFLFVNVGGKVVAVGDEFQAIYSWRGADSDSMGEMSKLMTASDEAPECFPLTLNRRSAPAVIKAAQSLVPALQGLSADEWIAARRLDAASKGKPCEYDESTANGLQEHFETTQQLFDTLSQERKGYVICRANAPLVSLCLKLLAKRIPAALARSNIVADLLRLIDTLTKHNDATTVPDLLSALEVWAQEKLAKLAKMRNNTAGKAQIVHDKVACIQALADETGINNAGRLKAKIDEIFSASESADPRTMVILSTVHGAKGNEAPTVYLLSPETLPLSIFDQVWTDARDRDNTLYVALTRCEHRLVFVGHMPTMARFDTGMSPDEYADTVDEPNPETADVA